MRNRLWFAGLTFILALAACNRTASLPAPPTIDPAAETQAQPSSAVTPTSLPLELPAYTPTPAPEPVSARPKSALVNCRFGPGTVYFLVGELNEGQSTRITGMNPSGTWYYIEDPGNPNGFCWVSADFIEVTGNVEGLPIVPPPPPSVIKIEVAVEPARLVVACEKFPQVVYFTADITTNAPALVTYRWEVSTGISSVDNAIAFEEAGTQTISEYYQIAGPNDYWIKMHVLGPNDISEQANFRVVCNP